MTSTGRAVKAFRHRNYRLFFGGQAISLIGTWMQQVAQAWLVLTLTKDPLWLGVVAAAQFLPIMLFGLFAGVLADSLPKRQTLLVTQTIKMVLSTTMAILAFSNQATIPILIILALIVGLVNAVDMPVRQSFAVEMVGREDIANAVALNSAMFNGARVIGPAVAGLTIGAVGVPWAFVVDAASFLAVLLALFAMSEADLHPARQIERAHSSAEVMTQLREGLSFVRTTPTVLLSMMVVGLVSAVAMNFSVVIPPLAEGVLHSDASGYGFLMAASGIGSLLAAISLAVGGRANPSRIALGAVIVGIGEIVLGLSGVFAISLLIMIAVGYGAILMAATANTTIQLVVPDGLRGRVMSVYTTIFAGSTPIGGLVMGGLASYYSVPISLVIGGIAALVIGLYAIFWVRRQHLDQVVARVMGAERPSGRPVVGLSTASATPTTPGGTTGTIPGSARPR
jgi:MFS family permease